MDVLRNRSTLLTRAGGAATSEQSQTCLDVRIGRIQLRGSGICIKSIGSLIVARFILFESQDCRNKETYMFKTYQSAEVIPDFRNVGIQANGAGIRVERISILVNLIVEHTNRAPESGVSAITVDGLLIGFVCLGKLLLSHVTPAEEIPTLRILIV
jgi:hypothetical protein